MPRKSKTAELAPGQLLPVGEEEGRRLDPKANLNAPIRSPRDNLRRPIDPMEDGWDIEPAECISRCGRFRAEVSRISPSHVHGYVPGYGEFTVKRGNRFFGVHLDSDVISFRMPSRIWRDRKMADLSVEPDHSHDGELAGLCGSIGRGSRLLLFRIDRVVDGRVRGHLCYPSLGSGRVWSPFHAVCRRAGFTMTVRYYRTTYVSFSNLRELEQSPSRENPSWGDYPEDTDRVDYSRNNLARPRPVLPVPEPRREPRVLGGKVSGEDFRAFVRKLRGGG